MDLFSGFDIPRSTLVLVTAVVSLGASYAAFQFRNKYYFWDRLGVKGTRPSPLLADFTYLLDKNPKITERERVQKYGKVHGQHAHGFPRLFIADPEVLRQVCIKDHDVFPDHTGMRLPNKYQSLFLVWLKGDHWRKVRAIMSPTFTSGKIKRMFRLFDGCAEDLIQFIMEKCRAQANPVKVSEDLNGYKIELRETFSMYSMDGISTCGYGLKLKREQEEADKKNGSNGHLITSREDFIKLTQTVFRPSMIRLAILNMIPNSLLKIFGFTISSQDNFDPLINCLNQLVKRRRNTNANQKYDDLLQLLLDAKLDDKLELDELDQAENHHAALTKDLLLDDQKKMVAAATQSSNEISSSSANQTSVVEKASSHQNGKTRSYQLNDIEVLSEAMFLLAAGLETTSVLLTGCVYCLAYHPEVQDKLYRELEKIVEYDSTKKSHIFQYESLTSCQYLDAVISETLRILPPAPFTDRKAEREYYIEKYNITVPKGCSILLGIRAVQNCADYWEKPDMFDPERFMPENRDKIVPGSYMPFSMGPRHCIGMRFSLTEAKLGLAKVVMRFRFHPAPGLKFPPEVTARPGIQRIVDPTVLFVARS